MVGAGGAIARTGPVENPADPLTCVLSEAA